MAPEIIKIAIQDKNFPNEQIYAPAEKQDIYALGILLYTMYFVSPPFKVFSSADPICKMLCSG